MQFLRPLRRFRTGQRDRFAFRLLPVRLEIKHHEHADYDKEGTDPFQQPTRITQNLDAALTEIFRVPRRLRNFVGEPRPRPQPTAWITERMIHPAHTGRAFAL